MSSNIPTRRVTRATRTVAVLKDKENTTSRNARTTTRTKPPSNADSKPTGIARATGPTAATRAKTVSTAASKADPAAGKRKREVHGEGAKPVDNRAENRTRVVKAPVDTGDGKGKERVKELKEKFEGVVLKKTTTTTATVRQPLRTVVGSTTTTTSLATTRRTRSTTAGESQQQPAPVPPPARRVFERPPTARPQVQRVIEPAPVEPEVLESVPEVDDAMAIDNAPIVPVPSPKRFAAARAYAASRPPLSARKHQRRLSRPEEEDEEPGRVFKKRRTSSDLPEEAQHAEVEDAVRLLETEDEADPDGPDWDDLDAEDADDPLMVSEYVNEIFDYLKGVEQITMPNPHYMENQKDLAWKMRGILIDWLIQVHSRFKLLPETLFLCVNIIDRFLSARVVSLAKLQLVGITSMFVAAKVEEIVAPSASNFLFCADASYTEKEILQAERYVLKTIDWNLSYPNPIHFLRRASKADDYNIQVRTIAKYFLEIQCLEWRLIAAPPSLLAAAAIWLARLVLGYTEWTPNLAHYSSYRESEIIPTANLMLNYILKPVRHVSFFKKYAAKKFLKASVFVRDWALERWHEGQMVSLTDELPELKALILEQQEREAGLQAAAGEYYDQQVPR